MKSLFAGYPNEAAVHVALGAIRQKLEKLKEEKQVQYTLQCYLSYSVQQKDSCHLSRNSWNFYTKFCRFT